MILFYIIFHFIEEKTIYNLSAIAVKSHIAVHIQHSETVITDSARSNVTFSL